jgi:16S rRNA (guanine527-N7)-methyltransferase
MSNPDAENPADENELPTEPSVEQEAIEQEVSESEVPTEPESTEPKSATLAEAAQKWNVELSEEQLTGLDRYCRILWETNLKLNLTRHTDYDKFVSRDVVDSMALEQYLDAGEQVLDLGTGGGVPGIILAILRDDLEVTLCDSVAKKAKAVADIVEHLGLSIRVVHAPAQTVLLDSSFNTIVCRAVAPISKILVWLKPHWDSFEQLLMIKGPNWLAEREDARDKKLFKHVRMTKLNSYPLPGTDSESVVLQVRKNW